jgi:hypothetical protein
MRTAVPNTARTVEAGMLLIGLGAILLLVSLFLEWYQPGAEAWDVFEAWDVVLAALAIAALVALASRLGFGRARPSSWLVVPTVAALVIVLYVIIDPPPAAADADPGTGLWLALAGSLLMAVGALLSVARISVAINTAGSHEPAAPVVTHDDSVAPGDVSRGSGRYARGDAPAASGGAVPPTEPTPRL